MDATPRRGRNDARSFSALIGSRLADALDGIAGDPFPGVHRARKRIKEVRALIRGASPLIAPRELARWTRRLRAAAHALAPLRDAEVLPQTIATFARSVPPTRRRARAFAILEQAARRELLLAHAMARTARPFAVYHLLELQRALPLRLCEVGTSIDAALRDAVEAGLAATTRGAATLDARGDADSFHDYRKQVKQVHYQLRHARSRHRRFDRPLAELGDALGKDHDLSELAARIEAFDAPLDEPSRRLVLADCRRLLRTWRRGVVVRARSMPAVLPTGVRRSGAVRAIAASA